LPPHHALDSAGRFYGDGSEIEETGVVAGVLGHPALGVFGLVRLCRLGHDVPWVKA
jgi:2-keto-4-pentenoate hydratase